ncbi:MAG: hypothetical protein ACHQ51_02175 [Elusimicrobiota bacterium]
MSDVRRLLALFLVVLGLAASARAQQAPAPPPEPSDEQKWVEDVRRTIPGDEIHAAAAEAEVQQSSDPLTALAAKYKLAAPDWLKSRIESQSASATLAALGDSVTAGTASCTFPYLWCPGNSWSTGDDVATSVKRELEAQSGREVHGLLVAVPAVTMSAVPAESFVVFLASVFGLNVERMTLLIGHNDPGVCGAPAPGAEAAFEKNLATSLRILGHVARKRGAKLVISGMVEVPVVARYADVVPVGAAKSCRQLWADTGRCSELLDHRDDPAVGVRISTQIAAYDAILQRLSAGKNWILYSPTFNATSRGGVPNPEVNFSPLDCFHPSAAGQARLGRLAWSGDGAGSPGIASFFALPPAPPAPKEPPPAPAVSAGLRDELDAWRRADVRP